MCTSPLLRFRAKKQDAGTFLASCTQWRILSQKKVQSYFKSFSDFRSYFDEYMDYQYIPCRKCEECKGKKASEWALRAYHENQMHSVSSFITLTIDDTKVGNFFNNKKLMKTYCHRCINGSRYIKYPINYTLCKGLLLDELKRMRDYLFKKYNIKIRYFGCGEYGTHDERPHYHIIIFGYNFPDKVFYKMSDKGKMIFLSEELSKLWQFGLSTVQDCNVNTCLYTAKYVQKAIHFDDKQREFEYYYGREPEFLVMSKGNCQSNRCPYIDDIVKNCKGLNSLRNFNNPYCKYCDKTRGGLGYSWFLRYKDNVLKIGYCTADSRKYPIPSYYLKLLELTDKNEYDIYKIKNLIRIDEKNEKYPEELSSERLLVRKQCNISRLKRTSRA